MELVVASAAVAVAVSVADAVAVARERLGLAALLSWLRERMAQARAAFEATLRYLDRGEPED